LRLRTGKNIGVDIVLKINNRRYIGNKYRLSPWIKSLILEHCPKHNIFFDVFGGTGVITAEMLDVFESVVINDFLYSNEVCYKAFFGGNNYDVQKLKFFSDEVNAIDKENLEDNYVSLNYGGKYFEYDDAKLIGSIREKIQRDYTNGKIGKREYNILLASLLYSFDRCANTVGHYEAYVKKERKAAFVFDLIEPIASKVKVSVYRKDANELARKIRADVAFVDPPYNSRQYSRFYHVMETIVKWDKPRLLGVAMKPPLENMSEYCRVNAHNVFKDLIEHLKARYIAVTYNNTYDSKSSSSRNKISLNEINEILNSRGKTRVFEKSHNRFNAGKTDKVNHKEILFIVKVDN